MISTHLKNIGQIGNLPRIGVKIKHMWNHHLEYFTNLHFPEMRPCVGELSYYPAIWGEVMWGRYNLGSRSNWILYLPTKKDQHNFFETFWNHWEEIPAATTSYVPPNNRSLQRSNSAVRAREYSTDHKEIWCQEPGSLLKSPRTQKYIKRIQQVSILVN